MKIGTLARRFLVPGWFVTIVYYIRFRAMVSPRAEVELSGSLWLGRGAVVSSFSKIKATGPLRIGAGTRIASGCFLDGQTGGLEIGENVLIGANCVLVTASYRYDRLGVSLVEQGLSSKGTRIGRNTFIGSNCVVLDGSSIGDDVIVAPNSVVSGQVPAGTVVSGNPAKVIFRRR
jgi:acetyltransferase-like isoleucine patch superfamily enzyme